MYNNKQGLGRPPKRTLKPIEELCPIDEVLTDTCLFEARVEGIIWEKLNSFGSKPYISLKSVHVQEEYRVGLKYIGTLDSGYLIRMPITDSISAMGLKSMDVIRFRARLKYKPNGAKTVTVYQAREITLIDSFTSKDEGVNGNE